MENEKIHISGEILNFPTIPQIGNTISRLKIISAVFLLLSPVQSPYLQAKAEAGDGALIVRSCEHNPTEESDELKLSLVALASDGTVKQIPENNLKVSIGQENNDISVVTTPSASIQTHIVIIYDITSSTKQALPEMYQTLSKDTELSKKLFAQNREVRLLTFDSTASKVKTINSLEELPRESTGTAITSRLDLAIDKALESIEATANSNHKYVVLIITDSSYPPDAEKPQPNLVSHAQRLQASIFAIPFDTPDGNPDVNTLRILSKDSGGYVWAHNAADTSPKSIAAAISTSLKSFLNVLDNSTMAMIALDKIPFHEEHPQLALSVTVDDGQEYTVTVDADCSDKFSLNLQKYIGKPETQNEIELLFQETSLSGELFTIKYSVDEGEEGIKKYPSEGNSIPINEVASLNTSDTNGHVLRVTVEDMESNVIGELAGRFVRDIQPQLAPTEVIAQVEATQVPLGSNELGNEPSILETVLLPLLSGIVLLGLDFMLLRQYRQARARHFISHTDAHDLVTMNVTIKYSGSQVLHQLTKKTMYIGRAPDNDIPLSDDSQTISRQHGALMWRNLKWYYSNLKPSQRVLVDGKSVAGLRLVEIHDYTEIKIGDSVLIFHKGANSLGPSDLMKTKFTL